jgi:hypothetical protein
VTRFPLPLLTMDGDEIITLDKNEDGEIVITYLTLNDINNVNLATINGDIYWTNPNIRKEISHDRDHLIVYNTSGKRAMTLEFMNPHHLSIVGDFYYDKYHISIGLVAITADLPDGTTIPPLINDSFFNHQIRLSKDGILMFTPDSARGATSFLVPAHQP